MSKFTKIVLVLLLILLVEIFFIYKGYISNKRKGVPTIKDSSPFYFTVKYTVNRENLIIHM